MAFNFYGERVSISEIDLIITSPISDLIRLKVNAGRNQDLSDVEHLKIIMEK